MGQNDKQEKNYGTYAHQPEDGQKKTVGLTEKLSPAGFKAELKRLFLLSWPVALCSLFGYSLGLVAMIFVGHLGKEEQDAVAFAISMLNVTGVYICTGLSTACDTLFSQAFGEQKLKLIGIYLQRGLIQLTLVCILCWTMQLNAEPMLLALGQNSTVSRLAAEYLVYFMPGLLFNFWFQVLVKYLQNQDRILATVLVGLFGNIVNVLSQYMLIYVFSLGTRGSAAGMAFSWLAMVCALILYIVKCGIIKETWPGWSIQALEDWDMFCKMAIAGLAMVATEWGAFEVIIFMSGTIGVVEQASVSVVLQITTFLYMVTYGFGIACSIRVGQNLGAGKFDEAKTSYRASQLASGMVIAALIIVVLSLRNYIPWIFTQNQEVADSVSSLLVVTAVYMPLTTLTEIPLGVLRGCGLHWIGGVITFIGYDVISIPMMYVLVFVTKIGVIGFWWAITIGMFHTAVICVIVVNTLDWQKQAVKARDRNKKTHDEDCLTDEEAVSDEVGTAESDDYKQSFKLTLIINRIVICMFVVALFIVGVILRVNHLIPTPILEHDP